MNFAARFTLYRNAVIHTLNANQPRASHVLVADDRIMAVGGGELDDLTLPNLTVVDLGGAVMLPGLTDAHIHWAWTSLGLRDVDLFDVPNKDEAVRRVAEAASRVPAGTWIVGQGWAQSNWEGEAFPTAADLDAVIPDHPVWLKARSGHAAWVNSAGLRAAGIGMQTVDPVGGVIQRDSSGKATGILFEEAIGLVMEAVPDPSPDEIAAWMLKAQDLAWRSGLTGIHDFDGPDSFAAEQILHAQGELGLRVLKNINDPYLPHVLGLSVRHGFGDDYLRIGGLKMFADGALGTKTAYMFAPYEDDRRNTGVRVKDTEEMADLITKATLAGLPSTVHAIGDRAVHDVLNAYQIARQIEAENGITPDQRRHRIEHVQVIHPDDKARLAELKLIASMQPIHATADYEMSDRYWGARSEWAYQPRLQIDQGVVTAFGSDSPVEPFAPWLGIHAAVTRRRADGSPGLDGWYSEARITLDEALRGYTFGAAYAAGMENRLGQIAPGYLADLILVDRDPYQVAADDPHGLKDIQVTGTMVGGTWRYRA